MNGRSRALLGMVLGLALLPVVRAAPPVIAQTEINYLLGFVERSGCEFYRNGSWYDSRRAQAHLRYKYEMLAARDQINTAEDFIEKAATKSSLSGRRYQVRCSGGEAVASNQWLRDELAHYRARAVQGAPRPARGALGIDAFDPNRIPSVVVLDFDVIMNGLDVFCVTRNGRGLVCRFLGPRAAGQPHDSILVRIDVNAPKAGHVLRSELGFDARRDRRIRHEYRRV